MFHLEDCLDQEALSVPVVPTKRQHFPEYAAPRLPLNVDDKINGFCDLGFGVGEGGLRVIAHNQIGETMQAFSAEGAPPGSNLKSLRVVKN